MGLSNYPRNIEVKKLSIARIVAPFYPVKGGSITHVIELTKNMNPYLNKQLIIAPIYDYDCSYFDSSFIVQIIRFKNIFIKNKLLDRIMGKKLLDSLYYSFNAMIEIKKLVISRQEIDLVYVHNITLGLFCCFWSKLLNTKIPIIIMHHHGSPFDSNPSNYRRLRGTIMKLIIYTLTFILRPDHYIQLNDGVSDVKFLRFLRKIGLEYSGVYHAIDTNFFRPEDHFDIHNDFVILSNHRIDTFKRVDLAVRVFKIFLDKIQPIISQKKPYLKIVGSGPYLDDIKELVTNLNIEDFVIFVGEISLEEMVGEITSSDVIIGTSLVSNVNRSIQEAMSCQKPVVVFGDTSEQTIFKNMDNSIVVNFGDLEKFAESIKLLFENNDLRERIGENARLSIKLERSWEARINQELEICIRVYLSSV